MATVGRKPSRRASGPAAGESAAGPAPRTHSIRRRLGRLTYLAAEHRLEVLAVEDVSPPKMLRAGLSLLLGVNRTVPGVRALQLQRLDVGSLHPLV